MSSSTKNRKAILEAANKKRSEAAKKRLANVPKLERVRIASKGGIARRVKYGHQCMSERLKQAWLALTPEERARRGAKGAAYLDRWRKQQKRKLHGG